MASRRVSGHLSFSGAKQLGPVATLLHAYIEPRPRTAKINAIRYLHLKKLATAKEAKSNAR